MAYNALNNLIDAYIYANGVQAITGQILNGVLKQMVAQLGSGYHLMGVATPSTQPDTVDYSMAYFAATAGEYTAFGGITLAAGEVAVLLTSGNGGWSKNTFYMVPTTTEDLENTSGFITNTVTDLVNYYTKGEIDGQKAQTDAALADRYTKNETDTRYYRKVETYDKDEVNSLIAALSRQEYIVAWDGSAAPDVSAIPAGVTVTYSGTTYTGTLAASASTLNKIYMVWNGTAYDMYGTSQDGGYSWVFMGTTTVDLSQYATKAEVSQLEHRVDELNQEINTGGRTDVRTVPGTGADQFFNLIDLGYPASGDTPVYIRVQNPASNFWQYGLGQGNNGELTNYRNVVWDNEDAGLGHINIQSGFAQFVVTSAVSSSTVVTVLSLQEITSIDARITNVENQVSSISEIIGEQVTPERCTFFKTNLFDPEDPDIELGKYIQYANGSTANNPNYLITGYIPISNETKKLIASVNGNVAGGGGLWCLYDSSKQPINIGDQMSVTGGIATWSQGAAFVRFSIAGYTAGKIQVEVGQTVTPYIEPGKTILDPAYLPEDESEVVDNYMRGNLASMGNGESITLMSNRVKSNKCIAFSAKVTAFSSLEVGHGGANYYGGSWIEITGTNIICHNYLSSDSVQTVAHGLTIANTIQVVIEQGVDESCSVKLISNGSLFTHTFAWRGTVGPVYAKSVGSTLTDAVLSWTADGLTQDIWGFGDSYFSLTSDARWTYYLIQDGHTKWLMNGQPGGNSTGAIGDLENLLKLGKPKKVFWAMGMNDPDSESGVNSSWNNAYLNVKDLCEKNEIELILATIPTVSGGTVEDSDLPANLRINKYKNAIIRGSGLRYVDFDKAVNADENTGQWYAGMLSQDGVHPTQAGALTLYAQATADFPELMTT